MSEHKLAEKRNAEREAAILKAIESLKKLARSYEVAFGAAATRTPEQQAVLADLAMIGFDRIPLARPSPTGAIDPMQVCRNDGKREVYLHVTRMLEFASDEKQIEEFVRRNQQ